MTIWWVFGLLTFVSLAFVMWPVFRRSPGDAASDSAFDREVYRDQLAELERDASRGLIDEKEKQLAYNEISRRLLKANEAEAANKGKISPSPGSRQHLMVALASAIAVTAVSSALYIKIGRPDLPDLPQEKRIAEASKNKDMPALIFQLQRYLNKNPRDLRGWKVLAPALRRSNRFAEAADAYREIIKLEGMRPDNLLNYAETGLLANGGKPNDSIKRAIDAALKMDKKSIKGRFYKAIVLQQSGQKQEALKQWRLLIEQNPRNIQLQMAVQRQIAALHLNEGKGGEKVADDGPKMPKLDEDQRRAAAEMTPQQRQQMIASMVKRLADRIKENGDNLNDWLKLLRVRKVMGNVDQARRDLAAARKKFSGKPEALARLDAQAKTLGLE